mmetsp:Transcript_108910/g.234645  ORF Transcript_108910/g.234645 Transcript_108910/m.234645 type:complete len:379 (-) Transcript_108910:154-1290(-)
MPPRMHVRRATPIHGDADSDFGTSIPKSRRLQALGLQANFPRPPTATSRSRDFLHSHGLLLRRLLLLRGRALLELLELGHEGLRRLEIVLGRGERARQLVHLGREVLELLGRQPLGLRRLYVGVVRGDVGLLRRAPRGRRLLQRLLRRGGRGRPGCGLGLAIVDPRAERRDVLGQHAVRVLDGLLGEGAAGARLQLHRGGERAADGGLVGAQRLQRLRDLADDALALPPQLAGEVALLQLRHLLARERLVLRLLLEDRLLLVREACHAGLRGLKGLRRDLDRRLRRGARGGLLVAHDHLRSLLGAGGLHGLRGALAVLLVRGDRVLGGGHGRLPLRLDAPEEVRQDRVHPLLVLVPLAVLGSQAEGRHGREHVVAGVR